MKRILYIAPILVIIFLNACAANTSISAPETKTLTTTTLNSSTIEVTAETLFTAYHNNNTAEANAEYKGKTLQVSGEVTAISDDSSGMPYVELSGGGLSWSEQLEMGLSSTGVQCLFSLKNKSGLAQLQLNQTVKIQGQCSGSDIDFSEDIVILDNCILVK
jgi:hypothetical protein